MKIAISAGHYISERNGVMRYDPGVVNGDLTEEYIVGVIYRCILTCLKDFKGMEIIEIPRTHLVDRVRIVNLFRPDLAIEVHMNGFHDTGVSGTETLYHGNSEKGKIYAKIMNDHIVNRLQSRDRGIKPRNNLLFLRATTCPAIITEAEFLSNTVVADRLRNDCTYQFNLTRGHVEGIKEIIKQRR